MSAELELRAAAQELRRSAHTLDAKYAGILERLTDVLRHLETPGDKEAKRITEQPTHSGQLPSESNRTEGEAKPETPKFTDEKPSQRIPRLRYQTPTRR